MEQHRKRLFGTAMRLTRHPADAEDLVQDVMERALRARGRVPAHANVRGWLLAILRNLFIDRMRAAHRRRWVPLSAEIGAPEPEPPPVWAPLGVDDVRAALVDIDVRFRRAYEMYELEGKSYKEIALALGIPVVTVGTKLLRVRRKLAANLSSRLAA
ncbi:MAG TPA: RNA polymerase sigma factor [Haliangiales bacterium]|nr:RNA polymerase sigma factor [Haliangiales bacterium]